MRPDRRFAFGHDLVPLRPPDEADAPAGDVTAPLPDVYASGRPTVPLSEVPARPTLPFQTAPRPPVLPPVVRHREAVPPVPRLRTGLLLTITLAAIMYALALSVFLSRHRAPVPVASFPETEAGTPPVVEVPAASPQPEPRPVEIASASSAAPPSSASAPAPQPRVVRAAPQPRGVRSSSTDVRDPWGAR